MTPKAPEEMSRKRRHARSQALAQAVVAAFTERLQEETARHDGYLTHQHIRELNTEFLAKTEQLTIVFEQAFVDAEREQEELKWFSIKRPAFDRLMVKRFEQLFMQRQADGVVHGTVSRRMLPGFFLALNMMLGPDKLEFFHKRSDAAVDRVMKGQLPVNWVLVDQDSEIHDIILDAQLAIAEHFEDTIHRIEWFIHIINTHLAPAQQGASDESWTLGKRAMHVLMNSLLQDLKKAVGDDLAWRHMSERHHNPDRTKITDILARFD
ncbi:MAG: hypothetical protein OQK24_10415 [Magnetovibrio sp.]|nr:hypothetical protein [Magnetovibrio sp.]